MSSCYRIGLFIVFFLKEKKKKCKLNLLHIFYYILLCLLKRTINEHCSISPNGVKRLIRLPSVKYSFTFAIYILVGLGFGNVCKRFSLKLYGLPTFNFLLFFSLRMNYINFFENNNIRYKYKYIKKIYLPPKSCPFILSTARNAASGKS